jgi:group I intron endonuclease
MGYIYKIQNKIDGKIYVGQTRNELQKRWNEHCKKQSNCRYLKSAIKKYNISNFDFSLICICFDDDLDKNEVYYIKKYNTISPNGYNLREGGNSGAHHEETKKKISEALKNRTDIIYGKHQLGKPHSEEIKQKISNSLKGIKHSESSINKRRILLTKNTVFQMNIDGDIINTFNGYVEAAKSIGTSKGYIWRACNGQTKDAKCFGFIWKSEKIP